MHITKWKKVWKGYTLYDSIYNLLDKATLC